MFIVVDITFYFVVIGIGVGIRLDTFINFAFLFGFSNITIRITAAFIIISYIKLNLEV